MIQELNDQELDQKLTSETQPALLVFWAPWSQPCQNLKGVWEEIAREYQGKLSVYRVNVDENAHAPVSYAVKRLPHCSLVSNNRVVAELEGRYPTASFRSFVDKGLSGLV